MNRAAILIAALALSACAAKPVVVPVATAPITLPPLPSPLATKADPLPPIQGTDVQSIIRDDADTTSRYNTLRAHYNALIDFYECVATTIAGSSKACNPAD